MATTTSSPSTAGPPPRPNASKHTFTLGPKVTIVEMHNRFPCSCKFQVTAVNKEDMTPFEIAVLPQDIYFQSTDLNSHPFRQGKQVISGQVQATDQIYLMALRCQENPTFAVEVDIEVEDSAPLASGGETEMSPRTSSPLVPSAAAPDPSSSLFPHSLSLSPIKRYFSFFWVRILLVFLVFAIVAGTASFFMKRKNYATTKKSSPPLEDSEETEGEEEEEEDFMELPPYDEHKNDKNNKHDDKIVSEVFQEVRRKEGPNKE